VGNPQAFRSPVALVVWAVWLLFAVGNWIDLAIQGRDHTSAVAAAILLLATGVAYVTALRPRIIADDAGVKVRNPLRDHRIGWAAVTRVDLADLLRVHCAWTDPGTPDGTAHRKVVSAWAVHYSRRRALAAEARARHATRPRRSSLAVPSGGRGPASGRSPSYGAPPVPQTPATEVAAEKVARLLSDRAATARYPAAPPAAAPPATAPPATAPPATGPAKTQPAQAEPPTSTWSVQAIAALVIPALILLLVWLL
jgi:Bacterial PH domain